MSSAMDKALMAMSIEEEDLPFDMPDLPEYSSCERNVLSLVGRTLNPNRQPMDQLIRAMPRKWQKLGRVRGVALSKERFQFFFNSEHDLIEVLEKGVHTFNEWTIVVDRWYESPPDNYLQFTPIWIQMWNLPINFYTKKALTALGEQINQVLEVAFDTEKPQVQEFVRAKILFDVSRPLRRSKTVNLPKGGTATVFFEYERVQKRCYECQRMTHDKDVCPLLIKKRQDLADARRAGIVLEKPQKIPVLKESDPLYGVLNEDQVGIDPNTGRPRIAPSVFEGMRQYLRVCNEEEKLLRIDKVKTSVGEVEMDPLAQKSILRLEPLPIFHQNINKDKGVVFNYGSSSTAEKSSSSLVMKTKEGQPQLSPVPEKLWLMEADPSFSVESSGSSGIVRNKTKAKSRKRPTKNNRFPQSTKPKPGNAQGEMGSEDQSGSKEKRKTVGVGPSTVKSQKLNPQEVIPKGGLPTIQ
ncbi:PREDICTED: uncharacterized protein LOC104733809 [Camelina sativa]|uniref:Uncharacterized protein LOC104733809 n=1 Tax=Camelina sativa TaxID=90675 RepID=A0ABM0V6K0_CAMSA|nr:PREDICTED: uncharacterized protein LOC104733809 [Camelina sativa]